MRLHRYGMVISHVACRLRVAMSAGRSILFRAVISNILNHPNFLPPTNNAAILETSRFRERSTHWVSNKFFASQAITEDKFWEEHCDDYYL